MTVAFTKEFSEGFSVRNCGPRTQMMISSKCAYAAAEKTYRTSVDLIPKMIPRYFVTTLRVDGREQGITYYERIDFVQRMRTKRFGETVNNFSKDKINSYESTLTYDPDYKHYRYVSRLDLCPRVSTLVMVSDERSKLMEANVNKCNGDVHHIPNGENNYDDIVNCSPAVATA